MNIIGTGRRLEQNDIGDVAKSMGLPTSVVLAIIEVEAAGRGFDSKNRLTMLPEGHVFYRELPESLRSAAMLKGLAWKNWKDKPYPKTFDDRWALWLTWIEFYSKAGYRSASYGLGQTMGFNAQLCGFADAETMFSTYLKGEREQLFGMAGFIISKGLVKSLVGKDLTKPDSWRLFALAYNGKGYEKNSYHVKLCNAFKKHEQRRDDYTVPVTTGPVEVLVHGMKGEQVRNVQADLALLGYRFDLGIDGRYGDETERNVKQFQKDNSLAIDGKVGPKTKAALQSRIDMLQAPVPPQPRTLWDAIAAFFASFRR